MLQVTKELLKEMTDIIVREVNPRKIILFGSYARGTARRDSDLDFLVVEDGPFSPERSRESEMTRLWDIFFEYNIPIDFLVFTPEEVAKWGKAKNHVVAHALREGQVMYDRT